MKTIKLTKNEVKHLTASLKSNILLGFEMDLAESILDKLEKQLMLGGVVGQSEQLVCPYCKQPFTKEELQVKEHCFNCGWEFAN